MIEQDDPTILYCTYDAPKRPSCGNCEESFVTSESDHKKRNRIILSRMKAWERWSEGREVSGDKICDNYKSTSKIKKELI